MLNDKEVQKTKACFLCATKENEQVLCCSGEYPQGFKGGSANWKCGSKAFSYIQGSSSLTNPTADGLCSMLSPAYGKPLKGGGIDPENYYPFGKTCGPDDCASACELKTGEVSKKDKETCDKQIAKEKTTCKDTIDGAKKSVIASVNRTIDGNFPKKGTTTRDQCKNF